MISVSPFKRVAAELLQRGGVTSHIEKAGSLGALIVGYHGILPQRIRSELHCWAIDESSLVQHLRYFKSHRVPVSIDELVHTLLSGGAIDPRWVVITFDDALQSQVRRGAEILADHGLPWSLAVPAGMIGTGRSVWSYEVEFLLLHCWDRPVLEHPDRGRGPLPMRTPKERSQAVQAVKAYLASRVRADELYACLDILIASYGSERFAEQFSDYGHFRLADWVDIRCVADQGVTLLSHGCRHFPLHEQVAEADVYEEIWQSRRLIERHTGKMPRGYALTHGVSSPEVLVALEASGYSYCLTSTPGLVGRGSSVLQMPRVSGEYPLALLRWFVAHLGRTPEIKTVKENHDT